MPRPHFLFVIASLLFATLAAAQTNPGLVAGAPELPPLDPGLPFTLDVRMFNNTGATLRGVTLTVTIDDGNGFAQLPEGCTAEGNRAVCAIGDFPERDRTLRLVPIAPSASEAAVTGTIAISSSEPALAYSEPLRARTFRAFVVENTADSGAGSLRAAIDALNTRCTDGYPCKISFRIAGGAAVTRIAPRTPLPTLTGQQVAIDGTTQTRWFGDTNPLGPEIEIHGGLVEPRNYLGNGLDLASTCNAHVRGLVVNGFPSNGILVRGRPCAQFLAPNVHAIEDNYIGTDATGAHAIPNVRGIWIDQELEPEAGGYPFDIQRNVISGNERSGIFLARAPRTKVRHNIIGLTARLDAGLGNGASGVTIGGPARSSDVDDNHIAFNAHNGVTIADGATNVGLFGNSFHANGGLAIDYFLDGPTASVPHVYRGRNVLEQIAPPEITSVRYDADRNVTVILGTALGSGAYDTTAIHVYTNSERDPSGYGEGQFFLGWTIANESTWRFVYPGRLPGPWVAATTTRYSYIQSARAPQPQADTSSIAWTTTEFSRAVREQD